ncbi:MAG: HD domain-containing protein [Armatimonadota bacterium]|nr:HD domain-containing protein [Armatimonadota bacterium]
MNTTAVWGSVLVVDEDARTRELLSELLGAHRYAVVTARGAAEALARAAVSRPDVVLVDETLADGDGASLCLRLRAEGNHPGLPIVLIAPPPDGASKALACGADAVLHRPIKRAEVLSWVRVLVRVRRAEAALEHAEILLVSVAAAVEARSAYDGDHLWRVAQYSAQLAASVGVPEADRAAVRRAGILHDIGMIGVPDALLHLPRPLTQDEFTQIRPHPLLGADLCRPLSDGGTVAAIVRGHHERWHGGGYPHGLAGEAIPVGARIVAVADAYDALTSDRPYRPAYTPRDALDILRIGAGTQWDPTLVDAFASVILAPDRGQGSDREPGDAQPADPREVLLRYMAYSGDRP